MRKKILFLALASLAAAAMVTAACGDDDDAGDDGDDGGATATATVTAGSPTDNGGGGGGTPAAQAVTITATDFQFDKSTITAQAGQPINITLENDGSAEHSFTVGDVDVTEAEGGEIGQGGFTATEDTVEFHCKYHSSMTGTITISEDAASAGDSGGSGGIGAVGY